MTATNPNKSQPLSGQDAIDASVQLSDRVRGMQGSQGTQPPLRDEALKRQLGIADEE